MSKLELLAKQDGDQDSPVDIIYSILANYSAKHEFDTSVLDSIFEGNNDRYIDKSNRVTIEYLKNNKSDYVILEDYSTSDFTITDVVKTFRNFYWEDPTLKTKPLWRHSTDEEGHPTDSDIIVLQESGLYDKLPIKYESVSYFNIKETKKSKLPEECLIEVGITYVINEVEYNTHEVIHLDLRDSYSDKFIDRSTGLMEVKTLHGIDINLPIQWEDNVTHEIRDLYWENQDTLLPLIYSYFGKSTESRSFLIVYNEKTIYVYSLKDSIEKYWIDYCKIYPLNSITNE